MTISYGTSEDPAVESEGHTGTQLRVAAFGPHAANVSGLTDQTDLFFITGTDAMATIDTWKDVDELWQLAHFVVVTRPGHTLDLPAAPAGAISVVEIPALEISSTAIRERVRAGRPLWYLLPDGVVSYIAKNELYQPEGGHK